MNLLLPISQPAGCQKRHHQRRLTIVRSAVNFHNKHHDTQLKNPLNGFKLFEQEFIPRYLSPKECSQLLSHTKGYNANT